MGNLSNDIYDKEEGIRERKEKRNVMNNIDHKGKKWCSTAVMAILLQWRCVKFSYNNNNNNNQRGERRDLINPCTFPLH